MIELCRFPLLLYSALSKSSISREILFFFDLTKVVIFLLEVTVFSIGDFFVILLSPSEEPYRIDKGFDG